MTTTHLIPCETPLVIMMASLRVVATCRSEYAHTSAPSEYVSLVANVTNACVSTESRNKEIESQ